MEKLNIVIAILKKIAQS